jgi:hypothetical protein
VAEIAAGLRLFVEVGQVAELRILNAGRAGTVAGYFDSVDAMAKEAARWSGKAPGVYFTINPVKPALLARANNRLIERARTTTGDIDIERRLWLPIDFDAVRPAGISATELEHQAAIARARQCRDWLSGGGWPSPILADSSNGGHLPYLIDLPNDEASAALLKRCLAALDFIFSDAVVTVDQTVWNAGRIWKVYGTLACKGDSTAERPHRVAKILEAPERLVKVPRDLLEALAAQAPKLEEPARNGSSGTFDAEAWIRDHVPNVVSSGPWKNGGKKWVLNPCPWNDQHTNKSAFIVRWPNGTLGAGCHHNGCAGKDWHALRDLYEPGWREQKRARATASGKASGKENADKQGTDKQDFPAPIPASNLLREETQAGGIWEGMITPGGITLLSALWKCGKTTLLAHLVKRRQYGGTLCGLSVSQGGVLYVTEERQGRWAARRDQLEIGDHAHFLIRPFASKPTRDRWLLFLLYVKQIVLQGSFDLIVLDTLANLWPVRDENDAAEVQAALMPLHGIAGETGAALLLVHHLRKGDGEEATGTRGSGALAAFVDTILELRRFNPKNRKDRRRVLTGYSRLEGTPDELVIELEEDGSDYTSQGDREHAVHLELCESIKERLPAKPPGVTLEELREQWPDEPKPSQRTLGNELPKGIKAGLWARSGEGVKGDPYRYFLMP